MDLRFRIDALDLVLLFRNKTHRKCQRTDTSEEHDRDDCKLTQGGELRSCCRRKTDCTKGRRRFKHQIKESKLSVRDKLALRNGKHTREKQKQRETEDKDRNRTLYR